MLKAAAAFPLVYGTTGVLRARTPIDQAGFPYGKPVGQFPEPAFVRDALRLHFGSALSAKQNLFIGWDDAIIAHGMAPEPVGKETLKSFYTAVFTEFPDFRLVDDALLVAGDMGAHRYHALGTHLGGSNPTGKKIMFRGQTIYRVNEHGKVNWRISNHDHDFRESQLAYNAGDPMRSWFPSSSPAMSAQIPRFHDQELVWLPEPNVRHRMAAFAAALDSSDTGNAWRFYRSDAVIRGLSGDSALAECPLDKLKHRFNPIVASARSFRFYSNRLIVSGPYAIQQYSYWDEETESGPTGCGETIYRFDPDYKIAEQWINHDLLS